MLTGRFGASAWLDAAVALLFPPRCAGCGEEVGREGRWCRDCLANVWDAKELELAGRGLQWLDSCHAVTAYEGGVKKMLHGLKFEGHRRNAAPLSGLLELMEERELPPRCDLAAPVPLATARRAERGYDQVALIFEEWCRCRNVDWQPDILRRVRNTRPQWTLEKTERKTNVKGAFVVTRPAWIQHKTIWLLDDISTTGYTMDACAEALKRAGARTVIGLVIAAD